MRNAAQMGLRKMALFTLLLSSALMPGLASGAEAASVETANPKLVEYVEDLKSNDAAKHATATKALVEQGGHAYNLVALLRKSTNAGLGQRAQQVCQQIEARARQLMLTARKLNFDLTRANLAVENLKKVQTAFRELARYTPYPGLKKNAESYDQQLDKQIQTVQAAADKLAILDGELAAKPTPQGIAATGIHAKRAEMLFELKRYNEVLSAAEAGLAAGGANNRFLPALLKSKAQVLKETRDPKGQEETCTRLLKDCPNSLESRDAHVFLIQLFQAQEREEDQLKQLKAFARDFPRDKDMQDLLLDSLQVYYEVDPNFARAAELAEFMIETLPPSRLTEEVVGIYAQCNEYVVKDYQKAQRGYKMLLDIYPDIIEPKTVQNAEARIKNKLAGSFPKGPNIADKGPEGVFAAFIAAMAKPDLDALEELTQEDDFDLLDLRIEEIMVEVVLSDYVVEKVEADEKTGKASLTVKHFTPSEAEPATQTIKLVKEAEKWRVHWPDPDFDELEEDNLDGFVAPPAVMEAKPEGAGKNEKTSPVKQDSETPANEKKTVEQPKAR